MANINDFKLLNLKCLNYYNLLETELGRKFTLPSEKHKERFGFYLLMLEALCNIKDIADQLAILTDKEFNKIIFGKADDDFGVDAIYIDENTNYINFFNFKFRNEFNPNSGQKINEAFLTSKLTNAIMSNDLKALSGKTKDLCKEVIKRLNGKEIWRLRLYAISNEIKELNVESMEITQLRNLYDLETESINLNTIVKYMSIRPVPIDAILHLSQSSILPYTENSLSSSKSYVISIPATELIRITCNNKTYRDEYGMEDFEPLKDIDMDYNLLFDNVRGLIVNSKFNDNIFKTLKDEPSKFFMYNNGLTLTAADIITEDTNGNTKIKITIKDFQVVNGGQTLRTLHKFNSEDEENITNYLSNVEILLRIFKTPTTNNLRNKIAQFTNSQNAISNMDLKSLTSEQIHIEQFLSEQKIVYARKIGDTGIDPSIEYTH
ncbi:MAG: AIPR family protein, partial [Ignavibacteriae bacterium]|nr:AIPR family protein [Ignavibacteriota bacterium]